MLTANLEATTMNCAAQTDSLKETAAQAAATSNAAVQTAAQRKPTVHAATSTLVSAAQSAYNERPEERSEAADHADLREGADVPTVVEQPAQVF